MCIVKTAVIIILGIYFPNLVLLEVSDHTVLWTIWMRMFGCYIKNLIKRNVLGREINCNGNMR